MPSRRDTSDRPGSSPRLRCVAVFAILFAGCTGDFGRPRYPEAVTVDRRAWMSETAAVAAGNIVSAYPLTDEEISPI